MSIQCGQDLWNPGLPSAFRGSLHVGPKGFAVRQPLPRTGWGESLLLSYTLQSITIEGYQGFPRQWEHIRQGIWVPLFMFRNKEGCWQAGTAQHREEQSFTEFSAGIVRPTEMTFKLMSGFGFHWCGIHKATIILTNDSRRHSHLHYPGVLPHWYPCLLAPETLKASFGDEWCKL